MPARVFVYVPVFVLKDHNVNKKRHEEQKTTIFVRGDKDNVCL